MIDFENPVFSENVQLLLEGFWHKELPPLFNVANIHTNVETVLRKIATNKYSDQFNIESDLICEYKNFTAPSYVYNDGSEPITFFDFKKNGSLREMQLPNLKYYITFMYNILSCYDNLFKKLYSEPEFNEYIDNSNSFILFNESFRVFMDYDNDEEIVEEGVFAVNNNKTTGQLVYEKNNNHYLKKQASYLYSAKIDIESFYPNIYTHYLSKIKNAPPFNQFENTSAFFDFLDYYNMKINNNQTKGIVTGVFSSVVSSELLMLCVDYEIRNAIGESVEYIRYVDDLTFFSDSLEEINSKLASVQQILNKYRLRINNSKTEQLNAIHNVSYTNLYELKNKFDFFNSDSSIAINKDIFYNIKRYISKRYYENEKSEIKAFLTLLKYSIINGHLILESDEDVYIPVYLSCYMMQLSCLEPLFASRCYKVIEAILEKSQGTQNFNDIILEMKNKCTYVNKSYNETILQIWHYYLLGKYDANFSVTQYLKSIEENEANPLILASLIKEGRRSNREIMKYIKTTYSNIEKKEGEPDFWKVSIMNSKWWLPLFILQLKDGADYDSFFSSAHFNRIYKNLIN